MEDPCGNCLQRLQAKFCPGCRRVTHAAQRECTACAWFFAPIPRPPSAKTRFDPVHGDVKASLQIAGAWVRGR
jgi:hypothetical protein